MDTFAPTQGHENFTLREMTIARKHEARLHQMVVAASAAATMSQREGMGQVSEWVARGFPEVSRHLWAVMVYGRLTFGEDAEIVAEREAMLARTILAANVKCWGFEVGLSEKLRIQHTNKPSILMHRSKPDLPGGLALMLATAASVETKAKLAWLRGNISILQMEKFSNGVRQVLDGLARTIEARSNTFGKKVIRKRDCRGLQKVVRQFGLMGCERKGER